MDDARQRRGRSPARRRRRAAPAPRRPEARAAAPARTAARGAGRLRSRPAGACARARRRGSRRPAGCDGRARLVRGTGAGAGWACPPSAGRPARSPAAASRRRCAGSSPRSRRAVSRSASPSRRGAWGRSGKRWRISESSVAISGAPSPSSRSSVVVGPAADVAAQGFDEGEVGQGDLALEAASRPAPARHAGVRRRRALRRAASCRCPARRPPSPQRPRPERLRSNAASSWSSSWLRPMKRPQTPRCSSVGECGGSGCAGAERALSRMRPSSLRTSAALAGRRSGSFSRSREHECVELGRDLGVVPRGPHGRRVEVLARSRPPRRRPRRAAAR